jgi:hypothetical protein
MHDWQGYAVATIAGCLIACVDGAAILDSFV